MTPIRFASLLYDRTEALRSGDVRLPGFELDYVALDTPREIFDRMVDGGEFDAAELSISEFVSMAAAGDRRFVAIPVFPARVFRHGYIFVNRHAGIEGPRDLEGRRIGVPLYAQTAAVWLRGHLQHQYGVDLSTIKWVQGALEKPGLHGTEKQLKLLKPVDITLNVSGRSLIELLIERRIDAVLGARTPRPHMDVQRLFPNFRQVERDFFIRTRIFPIMHLVAIRRAVHEAHPDLAPALYAACLAAKQWAMARLRRSPGSRCMLPWAMDDLIEIDEVFGDDPFPYGVEANRATLQALVDYMQEQGLIERAPAIEDLFVLQG